MTKLLISLLFLFFTSSLIFAKEPVVIGEGFKKMIKKRDVDKPSQHLKNEYTKFHNFVYTRNWKLVHNYMKSNSFALKSKGDQMTAQNAAELFVFNSSRVTHDIAYSNGSLTTESLNEAIEFWNKHKSLNMKYWINQCKKTGKINSSDNHNIVKHFPKTKPFRYEYFTCTIDNNSYTTVFDF